MYSKMLLGENLQLTKKEKLYLILIFVITLGISICLKVPRIYLIWICLFVMNNIWYINTIEFALAWRSRDSRYCNIMIDFVKSILCYLSYTMRKSQELSINMILKDWDFIYEDSYKDYFVYVETPCLHISKDIADYLQYFNIYDVLCVLIYEKDYRKKILLSKMAYNYYHRLLKSNWNQDLFIDEQLIRIKKNNPNTYANMCFEIN